MYFKRGVGLQCDTFSVINFIKDYKMLKLFKISLSVNVTKCAIEFNIIFEWSLIFQNINNKKKYIKFQNIIMGHNSFSRNEIVNDSNAEKKWVQKWILCASGW